MGLSSTNATYTGRVLVGDETGLRADFFSLDVDSLGM